MLLAPGGMKRPLRSLVVLATVGMVACGGKRSTSDGGTAGMAGNAAGRGGGSGMAGGAGSGAAARGGAGGATGGGEGAAAGASGNGGTTGAGGAGTSGNAGRGGGAGTSGASGTGGEVGRGGTTGTAGTGGSDGRGGSTGAAGAGTGGSDGRGGATGTGGTLGGRCTEPADCSGTLPTASFCVPSWSCVEGRCAAECMGGRTCTESPSSGCLRCRVASTETPTSQGCANTPCVFDAARIVDVQQSGSCQPAQTPNFATWFCTGQWATFPTLDGSRPICTIQTVPTGLERWSVSCGACVSIVTIGN
jgi:hypothetical protein